MREQKSEIWKKIADTKDLDDAAMQAISGAIGEFQKQYDNRRTKTGAGA
jgi:hypothetical protein